MQIYYNGTRLDLDNSSVIALTFVANDLQKPETVQSSYSNTISIPATLHNIETLKYSNILGSQTKLPYRQGDVQVLDNGRDLFPFAKGEITGYANKRFSLLITAGNLDVFERLGDKSIRDLDLGIHTHTWDLGNIAAGANQYGGYWYPLLNRGKRLDLDKVDVWDMWPATFTKNILQQMMLEAGLSYTGLDSDLVNKSFIPSIKKYEYPTDFTKPRSWRIGIPETQPEIELSSATEIYRLPFNNYTSPTYYQGEELAPDTLYNYVAPQTMRVTINADLLIHMEQSDFAGGKTTARIDIMHNDNPIGGKEIESSKPVRGILKATAENVLLKKDDKVWIRFRFIKPGLVKGWVKLYQRRENDSFGKYANAFEVRMLPDFPHGGEVEIAKWLPDIKQKDFLKFLLQLHAGMMQTDMYTETVNFNEFKEVEENTANALDWSDKYIPETEDLSYKFSKFAQNNYIRWKEDSTSPAGYNDGLIVVDNENLELSLDIISFPFAATPAGGSFLLPSLLNYKEKPEKEPIEYDNQDIQPRILLQSSDVIEFTLFDADNLDAQTNTRTVVGLQAYFDDVNKIPNFNLNNYIIPTYYEALESILNNSKYLKVQFNLKASDVSKIDFTKPVWLRQYGQYFYVNKVNEFIAGKPTVVEIARL